MTCRISRAWSRRRGWSGYRCGTYRVTFKTATAYREHICR